MGMSWAEHTVEIEAPIEISFDAIVDYESFPGWQGAVDSVDVLSQTKDGLGEDVHLFVDAKVRKIDYVLRYSYDRPTEIRWDFVEGNGMRDVDGVYTFEELGPSRTRATYKLGADPEIPVPGMVARRVHKQLVQRSVEDLKHEAERRYAAEGAEPGVADEEADETEDKKEGWAPEPSPYEAAGAGQSGADWEPKARREPPSSRPAGGRTAIPSLSELPGELLSRADALRKNPVTESKELAESAVRAGRSLTSLALELGKEAADRVDRALSGRSGRR